MFKKYVRKIIVHWITISGFVLIAAGTLLTYIGQNTSNRIDDKQLHQSTREKSFQIDKIVKNKNKLLARIDEYQENLSEKEEIIQLLKARISEINRFATEQSTDEQVDVSVDEPDVIATEQHVDKQIEAGIHAIPENNLNDVILQVNNQVNNLCAEGKKSEAYDIADNLRQKHPDCGPAYFLLGMIEMYRENYINGEEFLYQAIELGLPDEDMAWAYHNLSYSLLQKEGIDINSETSWLIETNWFIFEKAKRLLEKALEFNPDMEESKKILKLLADLH